MGRTGEARTRPSDGLTQGSRLGICCLLSLLLASGAWTTGVQAEERPGSGAVVGRPGTGTRSTPRRQGPFVGPARQWAVLIGVSRYLHLPEKEWLASSDADARSFHQFLLSPRGGEFRPDHVQLLLNEAATTTKIRLAVDYLVKHVQEGDVAYLMFAGHGKVERYGGGEVAYLMPYDSDPEHLNATAIPMDELRRYVDVNLRHASQVVLITDACHAGSMGQERDPNDMAAVTSSVNDHLSDIGSRNGVLNLMACRRDERSMEDVELGHGLFTYCLLKALDGDVAVAPDGVVRAQDLLQYLMRQVPELSDQQQHPRHSQNYDDEFPMANLKLPGPALRLPPVPSRYVTSVSSKSLSAAPVALATLRVIGAPQDSELYLVKDNEQRTIGRVLSDGMALILEGVGPGRYTIVHHLGRRKIEWSIQLSPGLHTFDVRTGELS